MRKMFSYVFLLPLAVILILLSVANRQSVRFSLDPLNSADPALSLSLPLFVFLFVFFLSGMLLGGLLVWLSQGKYRKALREKTHEAGKLQREHDETTKSQNSAPQEIAPGLPVASRH